MISTEIQKNHIHGILYIMLHAFFDVVFYANCRMASGDEVEPHLSHELSFVLSYNLKALFLCIVISFIFLRGSIKARDAKKIFTHNLSLYFIMCFFSAVGFLSFIYALKLIIFGDAMALKYLEQILWIIIGVVFLKEKITRFQLYGILLSISGICMIIYNEIQNGGDVLICCLPLFSALCWAISSSIGKRLVVNCKNMLRHMTLYYACHSLILIGFLLLLFFIQGNHFYYDSQSNAFLLQIASMFCFYKAMNLCQISLLAPFVYTKIIISSSIGLIFFNENYELINLIAYLLIILGGITIFFSIKN